MLRNSGGETLHRIVDTAFGDDGLESFLDTQEGLAVRLLALELPFCDFQIGAELFTGGGGGSS